MRTWHVTQPKCVLISWVILAKSSLKWTHFIWKSICMFSSKYVRDLIFTDWTNVTVQSPVILYVNHRLTTFRKHWRICWIVFNAPVPHECQLGSPVIIVTSLGARRLISIHGLYIFLSTAASRPRRGSSQLPVKFVLWAFSLGVKRPAFHANFSLPSTIEVKVLLKLYLHKKSKVHSGL
jgi:hypothetical protein